jgi:glycosyltransferase involved in cell wall biosynthesis
MKLSICIPTYNRANWIKMTLDSINVAVANTEQTVEVEVCIADNNSIDNTYSIVESARKNLNIVYKKNACNKGMAFNIVNSTAIAKGDFVWILGSDDILMPNAISQILELIDSNKEIDFFYINALMVHSSELDKLNRILDLTASLDSLPKVSNLLESKKMKFFDLVNPTISYDFLGGIYTSVFRRSMWEIHMKEFIKREFQVETSFINIENTFPHVVIFARAYSRSLAYYVAQPLVVTLSGVREWYALGPLVMSFRLIDSLNEFRKNGMGRLQYHRCRNYALRNFLPHLIIMVINRNSSGISNYNIKNFPYKSLLYPNVYFGPVKTIFDKIVKIWKITI